jgi:predicted ribosome quality control (RQC) complex YloA/Tae2 family protein
LESEGYLRAKPLPKSGRKKAAPAPPRQFTTPAGHLILVGRNNLQNDRLTFKTAGPTDWWFHTQKIPGSHVILKAQTGAEIDDAAWNLACQLAAYFSQARQGTKVPVDYTQRKNVKKPPGAKPGYVIYDHFKSATVTPDPGLLKELGLELELE